VADQDVHNTSTKLTKKGQQRREEILKGSAALFAKQGFETTSIRQIADSTQIMAGSLYHHFPSKEDILHEILKSFLSTLPPMYEKLVNENQETVATLANLIRAGLEVSLKHPAELAIMMNERQFLSRTPGFEYVAQYMSDIEKIWFGVLQEGVRSGDFKKDLNINLVLRIIMDLISATVSWFGPNSRYTLDEVIETQMQLILHGLMD